MKQAIDFIYSRRKFAKSNGLERISMLLKKIGNPQKTMKLIHVAGTNGKGSTSTMISFCLKEQGYKVGLFTSPFVIDFLERIQINNEFVDEKLFIECVEQVKSVIEEFQHDDFSPTFFETVLAVALLCFEKSGCDVCVLEAGIGGRDDSTNVIPSPELAVLTSISFDHTDVLGNTLESITGHKCGIIKEGCSVISFPNNNGNFTFVPQQLNSTEIIESTCKEKNCRLIYPDLSAVYDYIEDKNGISYSYKDLSVHINFFGQHQLANSLVAIESLLELNNRGIAVNKRSIVRGLDKAFIPCRMEVLEKNGNTVILDGGHNEGCITALLKMVMTHYYTNEKNITAVVSFMNDKDYERSIMLLSACCKRMIFTCADEFRRANPDTLAKIGRKFCSEVYVEKDKIKAFDLAESFGNTILCTGSFYLVSDIRKYIIDNNT